MAGCGGLLHRQLWCLLAHAMLSECHCFLCNHPHVLTAVIIADAATLPPNTTGADFDSFMREVMDALKSWQPHLLVQFEDFGNNNAFRLLDEYRHKMPAFNDDIQVKGHLEGLRERVGCRAGCGWITPCAQ